MKTDSELQQEVFTAEKARELIDNPLFQMAFVKMQGQLLMEFQDSKLGNDDKRINAWQKGQILKQFEKQFTDLIKQGNNAKLTLAERAKAAIRRVI